MHISELNLLGIYFYKAKENWNHMLLFVFIAKQATVLCIHTYIWIFKNIYIGYYSTQLEVRPTRTCFQISCCPALWCWICH